MLAFLGLFGALVAGIAADAMLFSRQEDADEADPPQEDEEEAADNGDLLTEILGEPGLPESDDIPDPADDPVTLEGGDEADNLSGLGNDDEIHGYGGSDLIDGRGGDDWMDAGDGNDAVWGGDGDDAIWGGDGNDSLIGGKGSDILDGGAGDDWMSGAEDGPDAQEGDFLNGGAGSDTILMGAGDHATGGAGADEFILQHWQHDTHVAQVADYDPTEDQLVIVYDTSVHTDPVLTIGPNEGGQGQVIYLDGARVAVVNGAPVDPADIRLVTG